LKKYLLIALLLPMFAQADEIDDQIAELEVRDTVSCEFAPVSSNCPTYGVVLDNVDRIEVIEGQDAVQNDRLDDLEAATPACDPNLFVVGTTLFQVSGTDYGPAELRRISGQTSVDIWLQGQFRTASINWTTNLITFSGSEYSTCP